MKFLRCGNVIESFYICLNFINNNRVDLFFVLLFFEVLNCFFVSLYFILVSVFDILRFCSFC